MVQYIKSISLILFAGIIIIASGGINLYQHYCTCTDFSNKSLIIEDISCHIENNGQCCSANMNIDEPESCCTLDNTNETEKGNCDRTGKNCCEDIHTFLKTDDFCLTETVIVPFKFIISFTATIVNDEFTTKNIEIKEIDYLDNLPPPLYGKHLLCSLHQLKLDIPLA